MGMAMEMRITMMVITTISSTKVKQRRDPRLPLGIRSAIGSLFESLAIDVEHTLASPGLALRIVLIAAQSPFGLSRKRVDRDAAEEAHLLAFGPGELHALDKNIQSLR